MDEPKDCLKYPDAFLTGSHAYGTPGPKSDIDLVVMLERDTVVLLMKAADVGSDLPGSGSVSMRFGALNLIVPTSVKSLGVWQQGTADMLARKPVTRATAVYHFSQLRKRAGIT